MLLWQPVITLRFIISLLKIFPKQAPLIALKNNEWVVVVGSEPGTLDSNNIVYWYLNILHSHLFYQFSLLTDLTAVDVLKKPRFFLSYILASPTYALRGELFYFIPERFSTFTTTLIFLSANWGEREIWDLFGIFFLDHPDLRRLLSDYGFRGHALRKDFPLTGYIEVFYSDQSGLLRTRAVSLAQEYRQFHLTNPWGLFPRTK